MFQFTERPFWPLTCKALFSPAGSWIADLDAQKEVLQLELYSREDAGAGGSSCCVLDCQHSNEKGGVEGVCVCVGGLNQAQGVLVEVCSHFTLVSALLYLRTFDYE